MPGYYQSHELLRTSTETDELVKHMSNLPSYLERGDSIQEKAYSIGVLDWGHLEKWKHNYQHHPKMNSSYTESSKPSSCLEADVFFASGKKHSDTKQEECMQMDTVGKIRSVEEPSDVAIDQVPSFPRQEKNEEMVYANRINKKKGQNSGSSMHVFAESHAKRKVISACSGSMSADKYLETGKSTSGASRELHEPLLKPTTANNQRSAKKLQRDSSLLDEGYKSSHRKKASSLYPLKGKLDFCSCKSINVDESLKSEKKGPVTVQAFLQVTVKKGFPLLTFTVDRNSEILAATMRKLSTSKKADKQFVYTFCRVPAIKKNWMTPGCKFTDHACIPNVVAQMKVTDSQTSEVIAPNPVCNTIMREFVLSSVDLRKEESMQFRRNNELAAILLTIPEESSRSSGIDTTVILPGSIHTLPNKGEPSSLIQRWKSGGACDCGGWDLGCKLKVLLDLKERDKKLGCSSTGIFELSYQGLKDQRVFSLVPLSDGIFSAEFDSSLSRLQAFSICIAALDSRKLSMLPGSSISYVEKTFVPTNGNNPSNGGEAETPIKHVSIPHLSPIERV